MRYFYSKIAKIASPTAPRPTLPPLRNPGWTINPIDQFRKRTL